MYEYDLIEYNDTPQSEWCDDCMCEVPLDSLGGRECVVCNPMHSEHVLDEDGSLMELDFHNLGD